jgi:hypothetical protein
MDNGGYNGFEKIDGETSMIDSTTIAKANECSPLIIMIIGLFVSFLLLVVVAIECIAIKNGWRNWKYKKERKWFK